MNHTLEPDAIITFSADYCKKYNGAAYDGHFYYLNSPQEKKIFKYDQDFVLIKSYTARRIYTALCYDSADCCFWASGNTTASAFYRLSSDMKETDCIKICGKRFNTSKITGLSHNCQNDTILASFPNCIAEFSKNGQHIQTLQKNNSTLYSSVLSVSPYYAAVECCGDIPYISLFFNDQLIERCCLPDKYRIVDILFNCCADSDKDTLSIIILATDSCCCPCFLKCRIKSCDIKICKCNFTCCCNCRKCSAECTCDLIESIALMETALAHILNAEGEKLQKGIEIADNICDLLELNHAVNKTITNITFLEQILYSKLETAACCAKDKKDCTPDHV